MCIPRLDQIIHEDNAGQSLCERSECYTFFGTLGWVDTPEKHMKLLFFGKIALARFPNATTVWKMAKAIPIKLFGHVER